MCSECGRGRGIISLDVATVDPCSAASQISQAPQANPRTNSSRPMYRYLRPNVQLHSNVLDFSCSRKPVAVPVPLRSIYRAMYHLAPISSLPPHNDHTTTATARPRPACTARDASSSSTHGCATGVREMYLNLAPPAASTARPASCRFCSWAAVLYRPSHHALERSDRTERIGSLSCNAAVIPSSKPAASQPKPAAYRDPQREAMAEVHPLKPTASNPSMIVGRPWR